MVSMWLFLSISLSSSLFFLLQPGLFRLYLHQKIYTGSSVRVPHRLQCGYLLQHRCIWFCSWCSLYFLSFSLFHLLFPLPRTLFWCVLIFLECAFREVSLAWLTGSAMSCDMFAGHRVIVSAAVLFPQVPSLQCAHRAQIHRYTCFCVAFQCLLQFTLNLF